MHPAPNRTKGTRFLLQHSIQTSHKVENMFARLKDRHRIATPYDRRADVFMAAITMAAILIWWL